MTGNKLQKLPKTACSPSPALTGMVGDHSRAGQSYANRWALAVDKQSEI